MGTNTQPVTTTLDTTETGNPPQSIWQNITGMRFTLMEFSGGLGDLGTFIPLTLALALVTGMDIGVIFIFAGLFNIIAGIFFGLPIPVQPMKTITAVAIAEQLLPAEIAAAGLIMGAVLFLLGFTGWVEKLERVIPLAVIRGIQLGVGLKLAGKGLSFIASTPVTGIDSMLIAVVLGGVTLLLMNNNRLPMALFLILLGTGIAVIQAPSNAGMLQIHLPQLALILPTTGEWLNGLFQGALPQLPLSLLNSVLAVCVLSGDLFPGRKISTKKMSTSIGIMNLLSCWFGAMPMCHGSGGLAAQYRFGARTGGSMVMLGVGKVVVGLFFGAAVMHLLQYFPQSILGTMLLFAGIELAMPARDQRHREQYLPMLITVVGIIGVNTAIGFLMGIATVVIMKYANSRK